MTSKTSPTSSSLAAAIVVQACSTIARYGLDDKGLSAIAGGHREDSNKTESRVQSCFFTDFFYARQLFTWMFPQSLF